MKKLSDGLIKNAQIVLANEVIKGSLQIEKGVIKSIDTGATSVSDGMDWEGDYLLPGLIELHTDNLERYINPRPGVDWPSHHAVLAHDAQIVGAGITTVFDALSIGDVNPKGYRLAQLPRMLEAINHESDYGHTRADHLLHLRCEVSHEKTQEIFNELLQYERVHLVSIMDHTPGQRQFVNINKYREYYQGKYHLSDSEMEVFIEKQCQMAALYSEPYRYQIAKTCRERGLTLASHDDATLEHVNESVSLGMTIAEFPTTYEAAQASHEQGLAVLMGAPNVVRGGSHSGNIAAIDLATKGLLDILSSDYYPASLLQAVYILVDADIGISLPKAVEMVSAAPARAANLPDRGQIKEGLLADFLRVQRSHSQFIVKEVYKQGNRVF